MRPQRPGASAARSPLPSRRRRRAWAAALDPEAAIYAAKVAAASLLSLYAAFLLDLSHTYWALITVPFIVRPQAGLTVWRSMTRLLGTILGAVAGLCFVAMFAQSGFLMVACLAAWLFAMGFMARFEVGTDAYVYGAAGLTAVVVAIDTGPAGDAAFGLAVLRATETIIGIMAAFAVVLIVSPRSVEPALMTAIDQTRLDHPDPDAPGAPASVGLSHYPAPEGVGRRGRYQHDAPRLPARARREPAGHARKITAVANDLARLVVAKEMLARALNGCPNVLDDPAVVQARRQLQTMLAELPPIRQDATEARESALRLRAFERTLPQPSAMALALAHPPAEESGDPVQRMVLLHRFGYLADAMAQLFEASANLLDPAAPAPRVERLHLRYRDPVAALEGGLRPAITFVALSAFWIFSAWPSGSILAMLAGVTSLIIPLLTPRAALPTVGKKFGAGMLVMAVPTLILLALTPLMQAPGDLILLLGPVIFLLYYFCSAPADLPMALGGMIFLAVAYQPANLPMVSAVSFFNTAAALALLPLALQSALTILFPEDQPRLRRRLRQGSDRLLRRSLRGSKIDRWVLIAEYLDLLADYGGAIHPEEPLDNHLIERARALMLAAIEVARLRDCADALPASAEKAAAGRAAGGRRGKPATSRLALCGRSRAHRRGCPRGTRAAGAAAREAPGCGCPGESHPGVGHAPLPRRPGSPGPAAGAAVMTHEISIYGIFVPSLLICFLVASAVWLLIDQLMLRLSLWRFFWHPPLARLALLVAIFALTAFLAPNPMAE